MNETIKQWEYRVQTVSCILFWSGIKADEPQQLLNE
jgi:hypothetical protein